jgi:hypothetical protein
MAIANVSARPARDAGVWVYSSNEHWDLHVSSDQSDVLVRSKWPGDDAMSAPSHLQCSPEPCFRQYRFYWARRNVVSMEYPGNVVVKLPASPGPKSKEFLCPT